MIDVLAFLPVSLASAMLFKPLFAAAIFALSASASPVLSPSNRDMVSSLDMVIISDKNDAFLTRIVSTLLLATVSLYSFLAAQMFLKTLPYCQFKKLDANILYSILNGCLALVRKHQDCDLDCYPGCWCDIVPEPTTLDFLFFRIIPLISIPFLNRSVLTE